jgi:hypothetical protein
LDIKYISGPPHIVIALEYAMMQNGHLGRIINKKVLSSDALLDLLIFFVV